MKRTQPRKRWAVAAVGVALVSSGCGAPQRNGSGDANLRRSFERQPLVATAPALRRLEVAETPAMVAERLRARAEATVAACRKELDLRPFEADVVGRYQLQGRLSDVAMTRWLELLTSRAARLSAARACVARAEGANAQVPPPERLLPVLHQATLGVLVVLRGAAKRWADALDGARDASSATWLRTLRADATVLLPQDGPWAPSV